MAAEPVQTAQEGGTAPTTTLDQGDDWRSAYVAIKHRGAVKVIYRSSLPRLDLSVSAWQEAPEIELGDPCRCGCGFPAPVGREYADPETCRRRLYAHHHPVLDLTGMSREQAAHAATMAREAVIAARLGQLRATVASEPVHHTAAEAVDSRPSNRIRLDAEAWDALEELRVLWNLKTRTDVVRKMIDIHQRMSD